MYDQITTKMARLRRLHVDTKVHFPQTTANRLYLVFQTL